jgi:acyl-CoA reductase-like NAD-dependent aldehyde dehydrogenase
MTTAGQVEVIARQIQDAEEKGATLLTGGRWDGKSDGHPAHRHQGSTR